MSSWTFYYVVLEGHIIPIPLDYDTALTQSREYQLKGHRAEIIRTTEA